MSMDPTAAVQPGDSRSGREEPPGVTQPVASWSPWNGVCEAPARRSSRGWAQFGPTTNGINGSDWAAEFVEHSKSVSGGGRDEMPPWDMLETTKGDNRLISRHDSGRLAPEDWSTEQNWEQCACDRSTKDRVHVIGHASTCTGGTSVADSGELTASREAVRSNWKPNETTDDSEWQAFASCSTEQQINTTDAENQSSIFGSSVALGPGGHWVPQLTVRELASKPRSASAPLERRRRADAVVDPYICEQSHSVFRQSFGVPTHLDMTVSGNACEVISPLPTMLDQRKGYVGCG